MKNRLNIPLLIIPMAVSLVATTACASFDYLVKASNECIHDGYHYAANEATDTEDGNVEFWTCCECHNYFLTKPTTGRFVDAPGAYGYELPSDVIVPRTGKIAVNSLTLTFNGVDYETNSWTDKTFVKGAPAPSWSVTTDPASAAQYVDIWITKNEVEVNGWPTEVGDYVFCVGILPSNTKLTFGTGFTNQRYVKFSIVEGSQSKTSPVITFSLDGNGQHVKDTDPLPSATVSPGADYTITFSSDDLGIEGAARPTRTGYTWSIVVDVKENSLYTAKREWRWFYYDHDESETPSPESGALSMNDFNKVTKQWGSDGNNGVYSGNVTESDGVIDIKINAEHRQGGALESKNFYGPGSFSMDAKFPKTTGICYSIWTFYYADNGNVNHEIDIEIYDNNKVVYSSYVSETLGEHTYSDIDSIINDGQYHNYRIDWHHGPEGDYTEYFVDDVKMCKITKHIPTHEMKLWIGAWCPTWAGETMTGYYHMLVKNIKYLAF